MLRAMIGRGSESTPSVFPSMAATIDFLHGHSMSNKRPPADQFSVFQPTVAGTSKEPRPYLVHAAVLESSRFIKEPDEVLLQKLVRRRLVRLERVVAALGGTVLRQMPQGLLAAFETADAAVLGACEMQRRCSVIPQISETQIALKIGIQRATAALRAGDTIDPAEITAIKFASILGEGSVVVSATIAGELSSALSEAASPVIEESIDVAAHSIDWQRVPMLRLPQPGAKKPSVARSRTVAKTASIVFSLDGKQYSFGGNHPIITVGRDPINDIVINDPKASRQHCKIIHQREGYVLVDLSTNGTYLTPTGGKQLVVKKAMQTLPPSGYISPGHSIRQTDLAALSFEIQGDGS